MNSKNHEYFFRKGLELYQKGNITESITFYNKAIELKPDYAQAYFELANSFLAIGKNREVIACYKKYLDIDPNHAGVYNRMGCLLKSSGKTELAVTCFKKALEIEPAFYAAYNNLGNAFMDINKINEAGRCYKKALELNPKYAEAYNNLGILMQNTEGKDAAKEFYQKAIALNHDYITAYCHLSQVMKFSEKSEYFEILEKVKKRKNLSPLESVNLYFSLGKMYADIKEYRKSFNNYAVGNDFRKKCVLQNHTIEYYKSLFNVYKSVFNTDFFINRSSFGIESKIPVFIVGMPRSGTTLVEQIIASHPEVFGAGELSYLQDTVINLSSQGSGIPFGKFVQTLNKSVFEKESYKYINKIRTYSRDAVRITDKMPHNFERVWLIRLMFAKPKIIHCRRNPTDTCLSCYMTAFKDAHHPYMYDLKALGYYYRLYEDLMKHWHEVLPGIIMDIQYENIVQDQEKISKQIIDFCNLEWNEKCLEFHKTKRTVYTASRQQVRDPIYKTSMNRWKNYKAYITPLLEALNGK